MGINNLHDYVGRVEQAVRTDLRGAKVIALVEIEVDEQPEKKYWERVYVVAWQREDQCGTHRVHINSNDEAACFIGHYDMSREKALINFIDRGLPGNVGAANFLRTEA